MEWLTPLAGLYAAAGAIPLLLLLYFLKLRRREVPVSSTLLWSGRAGPAGECTFQRLRRNLLLLLQMLAMSAVLVALAGRCLRCGGAGAPHRSADRPIASMNATDGTHSARHRQETAKVFVESMRPALRCPCGTLGLRDGDRFDERAHVVCSFTSDSVSSWPASTRSSRATASLGSGGPHGCAGLCPAPGAEGPPLRQSPAQWVLFSDGRIGTWTTRGRPDELVFHAIGTAQDNVGTTAMEARRSTERPQEVEVFASLANYGAGPVTRDVQLTVDSRVHAVRSVTIPGCKADEVATGPIPSGRGRPTSASPVPRRGGRGRGPGPGNRPAGQ